MVKRRCCAEPCKGGTSRHTRCLGLSFAKAHIPLIGKQLSTEQLAALEKYQEKRGFDCKSGPKAEFHQECYDREAGLAYRTSLVIVSDNPANKTKGSVFTGADVRHLCCGPCLFAATDSYDVMYSNSTAEEKLKARAKADARTISKGKQLAKKRLRNAGRAGRAGYQLEHFAFFINPKSGTQFQSSRLVRLALVRRRSLRELLMDTLAEVRDVVRQMQEAARQPAPTTSVGSDGEQADEEEEQADEEEEQEESEAEEMVPSSSGGSEPPGCSESADDDLSPEQVAVKPKVKTNERRVAFMLDTQGGTGAYGGTSEAGDGPPRRSQRSTAGRHSMWEEDEPQSSRHQQAGSSRPAVVAAPSGSRALSHHRAGSGGTAAAAAAAAPSGRRTPLRRHRRAGSGGAAAMAAAAAAAAPSGRRIPLRRHRAGSGGAAAMAAAAAAAAAPGGSRARSPHRAGSGGAAATAAAAAAATAATAAEVAAPSGSRSLSPHRAGSGGTAAAAVAAAVVAAAAAAAAAPGGSRALSHQPAEGGGRSGGDPCGGAGAAAAAAPTLADPVAGDAGLISSRTRGGVATWPRLVDLALEGSLPVVVVHQSAAVRAQLNRAEVQRALKAAGLLHMKKGTEAFANDEIMQCVALWWWEAASKSKQVDILPFNSQVAAKLAAGEAAEILTRPAARAAYKYDSSRAAGDYNTWLLPMNIPGVHWWLLVVTRVGKKGTMTVYDSSGGPESAEGLVSVDEKTQQQCFPHHVAAIKGIKGQAAFADVKTWRLVFPRGVPQQQNGYSCGYFVAEFGRRIAAGQAVGSSVVSVPDVVQRLIESMLQYNTKKFSG